MFKDSGAKEIILIDWLSSFTSSEQWIIGLVSLLIINIFTQWVSQRINHSLALLREKKSKSSTTDLIGPVFWGIGRRYKILAVHQYEPSNDVSGYKHLGQNSRPDQWRKLVKIKDSFFGMRHEIVPESESDILGVIICRDGHESWKLVDFNK